MLKFQYFITLKEGFKPVMELETENEMTFIIEAKNRVTADRMVKAMLTGCTNIKEYSGICIQSND